MRLLCFFVAASLFGAVPVSATPLVELSEGMTTPVAGAQVETFDDRKATNYAGAGRTLIGSYPGSSAPDGDKTVYYSVQPTVAAFVAPPGVSYNYFGLYWGTVDEYNELRFYRDGRLIATVTGRDVLRLSASPPAKVSRYVNIYFGTGSYTRIEFRTSTPAFESDNHAFMNVTRSEVDVMPKHPY